MPIPGPLWPNLVTLLRVALVPALLVAAEAANRAQAEAGEVGPWRALAVGAFLGIGFTDLVDGYLARRFGWASELGALLDAAADKLVQVALVTYLALRGGPAFAALPLWFLALLILRDGVLLVGWTLIRRRVGRVDVTHERHGRLSSLVLFVALLWILIGRSGPLADLLFGAAALLVVLSTAAYVRFGFAQARGAYVPGTRT